ncbi:hypothetical protein GCM10028791_06570 [Echinicola sediminis]
MVFFYLTNFLQKDAEHVIHVQGCSEMPEMDSLSYLGPFNNSLEALRTAQKRCDDANVCAHCCKDLQKTVLAGG